jgi:hypothetical protein
MSIMTSVLHQSDTLFQRGRDSSDAGRESNQRLRNIEKYQRNLDKGRIQKTVQIGGATLRRVHSRGRSPRRDTLFH